MDNDHSVSFLFHGTQILENIISNNNSGNSLDDTAPLPQAFPNNPLVCLIRGFMVSKRPPIAKHIVY